MSGGAESALPSPIGRARADQVATLYASWPRTTASMLFGAALFCAAMGGETPAWLMASWVALVVANQSWRALLVRAWRRARPGQAGQCRRRRPGQQRVERAGDGTPVGLQLAGAGFFP